MVPGPAAWERPLCPAGHPLPDTLHFDEKIREGTGHSNAVLTEEAALVVI